MDFVTAALANSYTVLSRELNGRVYPSLITAVTYGEELGVKIAVEGEFSLKYKVLFFAMRNQSYVTCISILKCLCHGTVFSDAMYFTTWMERSQNLGTHALSAPNPAYLSASAKCPLPLLSLGYWLSSFRSQLQCLAWRFPPGPLSALLMSSSPLYSQWLISDFG